MISTQESYVALCPNCNGPHHYEQVRFAFVNDAGAWQIACLGCGKHFLLRVTNPNESMAGFQKTVIDEAEITPDVAWAQVVVVHNIPRTDYAPAFDLGGAALFRCSASGENLEPHAIAALAAEISGVSQAYRSAENYLASTSAFGGRFAVARVSFGDCSWGQPHIATLYTKFKVTFQPVSSTEFLLADVTGTDLEDRLEGVLSKSEIMDLLSKLLVRWHLIAERVVVASPFVGHQWDQSQAKVDRWHRLFEQLDPDRATLITRPATFTAFKKLTPGDVAYDELKTLGLENKLISANVKKHDFHAKFFIGMGRTDCEVLSGSANLVRGPSVENISFRRMSRSRCDDRYIKPMHLVLPQVKKQPRQFVLILKDKTGKWIARDEVSPQIAGG